MFQKVISELVSALVKLKVPKPKYGLISDDNARREIIGPNGELNIRVLDEPSSTCRKLLFAAIDAASATFHIGFGELSLAVASYIYGSKLVIYPELRNISSISIPVVGSFLKIRDVNWITDKYVKLGIKYIEDPELPEGALAHDVRIALETYAIDRITSLMKPNVLIIDGPIEYPYRHPLDQSLWNDEIRRLNRDRINVMKKLVSDDVIPISIVKRVWNSRSQLIGVDDVYTIIRRIINAGLTNKPAIVGPIKSWTSFNEVKYVYYVSIPLTSYLGSITLLRVEVLDSVLNRFYDLIDDVLSYIAYSSLKAGLPIPYKLHQADRVCKKVISSIAKSISALLKVKGVPMFYGGVVIEWG